MNLESHFTLLLELLVKSAALTVTGLALLAAMRKSSAANRHAVIAATFGALLLPLTKLMPPLWAYAPERGESLPAVVVRVPLTEMTRTPAEKAGASPGEIAAPLAKRPASSPRKPLVIPWKTVAVAVWLAGAALLLARRGLISLRLRFAVRRSCAIESHRLGVMAREAVETAGVRTGIRESALCRVPLATGVLRPVVLLPVEAEGWSDDLICSALRHELEHIRRRDCATRLLADIVCALHWLNPLVWLAARRMRLAQEQACDDGVLNSGACAEDYAGHLVDVVRSMQGDHFSSRHALAMAQPSTIETRIVAIMDATRNRSPRVVRGAFTGAAFAVTMLAICAVAQVGGAKEDKAADAVKRGLAFLEAGQNPDGSVGRGSFQGSVGVTSLAGLAMMADGAHAGAFERAMKYVLQSQQADGYFHAKGTMYDHGFATLFLAEAMRAGKALPGAKESVTKAVAVIQQSQNAEGGWRYQPQPEAQPGGDSSMTSCQVLALVAARDAGVDVPEAVINKAAGYLKRCQDADGGFHYILAGGKSAFPRSAAALAASAAALKFADAQSQPDVAKATDYVLKFLPKPGDLPADGTFFIHGNYYAAQAMRTVPGDAAKRWREGIREYLLGVQQADGSWADKRSVELTTSQACLILHSAQAAPTKGANSTPKGSAFAAGDPLTPRTQVEISAKFIEISGERADLLDVLKLPAPKPGGTSSAGLTPEAMGAAIKALDGKKGVDLLSAPRVTTHSKQTALIEVVREFKYPSEWDKDAKTGKLTPTAFESRDLGVMFEVTPEANADGTITLAMTPQIVEFDGYMPFNVAGENAAGKNADGSGDRKPARGTIVKPDASTPRSGRLFALPDTKALPKDAVWQPIFHTRKITTEATVWPGQTIVLGGMDREDVQMVEDRNPKTGRVRKTEQHIKRRLIVLVTASIVKPGEAPIPAGAPAPLKIESDSATFDKKTGTSEFKGNVEFETADAVITADAAKVTPKKSDAGAAPDAPPAGGVKAGAVAINPFQNLYLRAVSKVDGKDFVVIQRVGDDQPMKPFIGHEPGAEGFAVKSVRVGRSFRETKVILQKETEVGEIGFREGNINASAPGGSPSVTSAKGGVAPAGAAGKSGNGNALAPLEIQSDSITLDKKTGTVSAKGSVKNETAEGVVTAAAVEVTPNDLAELYVREWKVSPELQKKLPATKLEGGADRSATKDFLIHYGIAFPRGAIAFYFPMKGTLVVKNTEAQLARIEKLLGGLTLIQTNTNTRWLFPKIDFHDATVRECVEFLITKGKQLDPKGEGVNIVLRNADKFADTRISLSLSDVPLPEVLRYVAVIAKCEVMKEEFAYVIQPAGTAAKAGAGKPAGATAPAPAKPVGAALRKAAAIVFPKIDLNAATLSQTIDFLREKSKDLDPEKRGVNLILMPAAEGKDPRITLSLANIPLTEALRYIAGLAGLEVAADDHAITLRPAAK